MPFHPDAVRFPLKPRIKWGRDILVAVICVVFSAYLFWRYL